MKMEKFVMCPIKTKEMKQMRFLLTIFFLWFISRSCYSQNVTKDGYWCPKYQIVIDEIALKIDSICNTQIASSEPFELQGYMYYNVYNNEIFNDNKFYYYIEAINPYYSCILADGVVTNNHGIPLLFIDEDEIQSGFFKEEDDSIWIDLYNPYVCADQPVEDGDSIIKTYNFSFILPMNVDSVWLKKNIFRVRSY